MYETQRFKWPKYVSTKANTRNCIDFVLNSIVYNSRSVLRSSTFTQISDTKIHPAYFNNKNTQNKTNTCMTLIKPRLTNKQLDLWLYHSEARDEKNKNKNIATVTWEGSADCRTVYLFIIIFLSNLEAFYLSSILSHVFQTWFERKIYLCLACLGQLIDL